MYKIKIDGRDKQSIRSGNVELLLKLLHRSNEHIIAELKVSTDISRIRFLQGLSHANDVMINLLEAPV